MTAAAAHRSHASLRRMGIRRVRLATGIILFSYLVSHYTNHALGNVSLGAMEAGLKYHVLWWQSLTGTVLLYGALTVHAALGLWALYARRHFRWKAMEAIQLIFGLSIPFLLASHVVAERIGLQVYGIERGYPQTLYALWVADPERGVIQAIALLVAWVHGCIGLFFWLRLKPFFRAAAPFLLTSAVLLPTLALLGYYQSGRTVHALSVLPEWSADNLSPGQIGTPEQNEGLVDIRYTFLIAWANAIALVFVARGFRAVLERRRGLVRLTYPDGRSVRIPRGLSVLEASLRYNIPHASVCGGRGRCSTCRIRVLGERGALPPPSPSELAVLERVGFGTDDSVRLACQLRPQSDLTFVPLLPPNADASHGYARTRRRAGEERYIVSMFVDMRGSTRLAEKRMPFDIVFLINRFLAAVSHAVVEAGGAPNQFLGDGLLALFGLSSDPPTACRQAIHAAALISANVRHLNELFAGELREPVAFGIGIHGGEVIVGDVGYRDNLVFTALGDAVNVTARLQEMTKALGCEVVVSEEVWKTAGHPVDALPATEVAIRGRVDSVHVRTVGEAASLAQWVDAAPDAAQPAPAQAALAAKP